MTEDIKFEAVLEENKIAEIVSIIIKRMDTSVERVEQANNKRDYFLTNNFVLNFDLSTREIRITSKCLGISLIKKV